MKLFILVFALSLFSCSHSSVPITANPNHDTYTNGTVSSAKITDGPLHEGSKIPVDTIPAKLKDSLKN